MIFFKPHEADRIAKRTWIIALIISFVIVGVTDIKNALSGDPAEDNLITIITETFAGEKSAYDMEPEMEQNGVTVSTELDDVIISDNCKIYETSDSGYFGCGLDGDTLPFEAYYGFYIETGYKSFSYRVYSHMDDVKPVSALMLRYSDDKVCKIDYKVDDMKEVKFKGFTDGVYAVGVIFDNNTTCATQIYVKDNKLSIAYCTDVSDIEVTRFRNRSTVLDKLISKAGVTPENSLACTDKDIAYPTYANHTGHRCDTNLWRDLAHEIVSDDSLPDTVKLIMIHDWMTQNLAYDRYMVNTLKKSRANYYDVHDGTYSVYNTHAGKCADFANIFLIMARELGVPCSTLSNDRHGWNIVYVNGEWKEVDMTKDIHNSVSGEDLTVVHRGVSIDYDHFLGVYGGIISDKLMVGKCIYTDTFARTGVN